MKNIILYFFVIISCSILTLAQTGKINPVEGINSKEPDVENMKRKELQKELIINYKKAVSLQSQIKALNEIPVTNVPDFPDPMPNKSRILRAEVLKYYNISKQLNIQISGFSETDNNQLRNKIRQLQKDNDSITKSEFVNEMYIKSQSDSLNNIYIKRVADMYSSNFRNSMPVLSVSVLGNQFFWKNEFAETEPSLGVRVDLNSLPMLGSTDIFEFFGEYISPRFSTIFYDKMKNEVKNRYNTDMYNVGASINFPARFHFDGFSAGMKLSGGYYWGSTRMYNAEQFKSDWKGGSLRFELNLRKYTKFYPLEAYIAYNIYFPNSSFSFNRSEGKLIVAENSLSSLNVGLRMCFWWIPLQ